MRIYSFARPGLSSRSALRSPWWLRLYERLGSRQSSTARVPSLEARPAFTRPSSASCVSQPPVGARPRHARDEQPLRPRARDRIALCLRAPSERAAPREPRADERAQRRTRDRALRSLRMRAARRLRRERARRFRPGAKRCGRGHARAAPPTAGALAATAHGTGGSSRSEGSGSLSASGRRRPGGPGARAGDRRAQPAWPQ